MASLAPGACPPRLRDMLKRGRTFHIKNSPAPNLRQLRQNDECPQSLTSPQQLEIRGDSTAERDADGGDAFSTCRPK
ncbi:hypothetical protein RR48_05618 [Papilio machaon]|uniref:Uncharacterized protein n=1 Tax=Papilio machaon TaxID=76193 RepID=A0A0N1IBS1_PAPMA|nr:hypothetical protein RR48_05618 [Papilio machaon]